MKPLRTGTKVKTLCSNVDNYKNFGGCGDEYCFCGHTGTVIGKHRPEGMQSFNECLVLVKVDEVKEWQDEEQNYNPIFLKVV